MQYVIRVGENEGSTYYYGPYRSEEKADRVRDKIDESYAREGMRPTVVVESVVPWIGSL